MKKLLYLEATVVSYLTARPSRDLIVAGHQQVTHAFWEDMENRFRPHISALVYAECSKGDAQQAALRLRAISAFPMLEVTDPCRFLAERIITGGGIPAEYPEDALHIAIAAVNCMDFVVTWNFAHLNNPSVRADVRRVVESEVGTCPEICSPEELLEVDR